MNIQTTPSTQYTQTGAYSPPLPSIHHRHKRVNLDGGLPSVPNFLYKHESLLMNRTDEKDIHSDRAPSKDGVALLLLSSNAPRMHKPLEPRKKYGENAINNKGMKAHIFAEGIPPPPLFSVLPSPILCQISKTVSAHSGNS
mmetsp:Transcript_22591/g.47365  ORF Transcript_22591/g.47365 Transcript_22591/m.47365 type:complete len:141 (-) Transcript_22591:82-504(-)